MSGPGVVQVTKYKQTSSLNHVYMRTMGPVNLSGLLNLIDIRLPRVIDE